MFKISDAIAAYSAAAKIPAATVPTPAAEPPGGTFGDLVKNLATDAVEAGRKSEEVAKAALAGKADLREVVLAVNNAELTLETVVAVRDKVINAYNDILRMPI